MITSSVSGKGKKLCESCRQYVGVRTARCQCGHIFYEKVSAESPQPVFYAEAGRGRKVCDGCNRYVGVRTAICPCGFVFEEVRSARVSFTETPEEKSVPMLPVPSISQLQVLRQSNLHAGGLGAEQRGAPKRSSNLTLVHTPGTGMPGSAQKKLCPVDPESSTPSAEVINHWIDTCQAKAFHQGEEYSALAFRYMAATFWLRESEEYHVVCGLINSRFPQQLEQK